MTDKPEQPVEAYKKCDLFFKAALDDAMANQRLHISQEAAFYLMGILVLGMKKDPHSETKSLAEKYLLAQHAKETEKFKTIGDLSLIIAGIWWQSLLRKLVDVDYYVVLGSHSYQKVSETSSGGLSDLFEELAQNFRNIVNILTETTRCISEANFSDNDILRMYEVWLRTQNTFLEQKLRLLGINVVPCKTTRQ